MIKKYEKRGSHVGIIISFVIFVTFLLFLYFISRGSFSSEKKQESLLSYLKEKLVENLSSDLTTITVILKTNPPQNCVELNDLSENFGINSKIIVKTENQENVPASVIGDDLRINRENTNNVFFKIYNSIKFETPEEIQGSCSELNEGSGYQLGISKKEKYVFEKSFFELANEYTKYKNLKNYFKIPESNDFGFGFKYENGTEITVGLKNISKNIYIEEIPVQYIDINGDIKEGFIKAIIW